jgi:DNA-binding IclR family transcriptional regulator
MPGSLSLERGLQVLEALRDSGMPIGVRDIARKLDLSAPAVQRLLNTLTERGYVERDGATRRYRIGHGILTLARNVLYGDRLIRVAEPELATLAAEGFFNAFLGVRRGAAGVYLLGIQSKSPVVIRSSPGETMHLHSTALGKALLIDLSEDAIHAILGDGPFEIITPQTVNMPAKLISQIRAARTTGYTTAFDENIIGVLSIGAPVRDATGGVIGAISVAYPRSVGPEVVTAEIAEKVLASAARISSGLGYCRGDKRENRESSDAALR